MMLWFHRGHDDPRSVDVMLDCDGACRCRIDVRCGQFLYGFVVAVVVVVVVFVFLA